MNKMKKLYVSPHSKTQVILLDGVQVSQPWSGFPDHELSSEFKFDSDGIYDGSDYWQEVLLSIQFKLDSGDEYQTNNGRLVIDYVDPGEHVYLTPDYTNHRIERIKHNGAYYVPKAGTRNVWKYSHHHK